MLLILIILNLWMCYFITINKYIIFSVIIIDVYTLQYGSSIIAVIILEYLFCIFYSYI